MIVKILICLLIGYFFGCFSTGFFIGKLHHIDIRNFGSGNLGATNVLRTLGKKEAILTLVGDMLKCVVPVLLVRLFIYRTDVDVRLLTLYAAFGTVLGHNFPFYLKFHGGKGIAVLTIAILTFSDFWLCVLCIITFFTAVIITRYVSLGSVLIALEFPIWIAFFYPGKWSFLFVSSLFSILTVIRHRANIGRLIKGTENKIGQKKENNHIKGNDEKDKKEK